MYTRDQIINALMKFGLHEDHVTDIITNLAEANPPATPREYAVMTTKSRQIAEDHYQVYHPTVKVNDDTTIGAIRLWYLSLYNPSITPHTEVVMDDITIIQMQPL